MEVYRAIRPADWLPMPEPQDDEIYLLFHIPDGASSLLAFTVTCTGSYTVAAGTVENGVFAQSGEAASVASGQKYEAELSADDFGNLTSTGMKQCMVKVSGTDILTWGPSAHSRKTSPSNFAGWNIVEIVCRLPNGTKVACGSSSTNMALHALRFFSWYGENNAADMKEMFKYCTSLTAIPELDTSKAADMSYVFYKCSALTAVPKLDTSKATDMYRMFSDCSILAKLALNPTATGWAGYAIDLKNCSIGHQALVDLFNSLPMIASPKALTLTGNPGVSELTDVEKAIATGKNWTLTL